MTLIYLCNNQKGRNPRYISRVHTGFSKQSDILRHLSGRRLQPTDGYRPATGRQPSSGRDPSQPDQPILHRHSRSPSQRSLQSLSELDHVIPRHELILPSTLRDPTDISARVTLVSMGSTTRAPIQTGRRRLSVSGRHHRTTDLRPLLLGLRQIQSTQ